MSVSRSAAAKHLLKLQDAEKSFEGFVRIVEPTFELADFQLDLIRKLDALEPVSYTHLTLPTKA